MSKIQTVSILAPSFEYVFETALHETGFCVLKDVFDPKFSLFEEAYKQAADFFSENDFAKNLFVPVSHKTGYFDYKQEHAKGNKHPDLKEFFHFYIDAGPKELPFENAGPFYGIFGSMESLARHLLQVLAVANETQAFNCYSHEQSLLRVLHYPPLKRAKTKCLRAAEHEDINLITLLPVSTAPGLQVKLRDGTWEDVEAKPGEVIVNVGDMLQNLSNGFYTSATHRVVNPDGEDAKRSRYSMPFFAHATPETDLSPLEHKFDLVGDKRFPSITARDYLQQRLAEIGLKK
jgi:isopenicillin N synthase-like dioxygenase